MRGVNGLNVYHFDEPDSLGEGVWFTREIIKLPLELQFIREWHSRNE
ncbi:MAG: hypothetical protein ACTSUE_06615 [Promethearchaeota archaeon]